MITIPITITGDHWLNDHQTEITLGLSPSTENVVLDIGGEGPSLHRLGVIDRISELCVKHNRDPKTIWISRWSNPAEQIPFRLANRSAVSHFYWTSERYRPSTCISCEQAQYLFGYFMGRPTVPRMLLLQHLSQRTDTLLSRMCQGVIPSLDEGVNLDRQEFAHIDHVGLARWYHHCGIASLDGATIRDQYTEGKNTNLSLLAHYDRFCIEIVAESYIYGDTFFPTEKTIRPLLAGRPILVMGPRHFLRRLRDQGFHTWNYLWDESYDELEGADRLSALQHLILDIADREPEIRPRVQESAEHNHNTVNSIAKKNSPGPF